MRSIGVCGTLVPARRKGRDGWQKRPDGWLHDQITNVLRSSKKPLSALNIARSLQRRYPDTYVSTVFRALARMLNDGRVERVELLSAYILTRKEARIGLVCRECGTYAETSGVSMADLSALVQATGFKSTRVVLEVDGSCTNCSSA